MRNIVALFLILLFVSCNKTKENLKNNKSDRITTDGTCCNKSEYLVQSILWFQRSPEMQALYLQSFNSAKKALKYNINHKIFPNKKNAVVVDIDETVLNNSLYEGWLYINNKVFNGATWTEWVNESKAKPLPGTIDFLNYAKKIGCEIFYISNRRKDTQLKGTLIDLKRYNLPFADENHLFLKAKSDTTLTGITTKENRRLKIEDKLNFEILLLCGDQAADFDKAFDVQKEGTENQIKDSILKYKEKFGSKFIIVPNPMYSSWLNKIMSTKSKNDSCDVLKKNRKSKIISWK
jgi:5'-nucleotidase (lipoprotein e(P4) family)